MNTKKWYQSRTIILSIITTAIGVAGVIQQQYGDMAWLVTLVGILNAVLRVQTSTTIGTPTEPKV